MSDKSIKGNYYFLGGRHRADCKQSRVDLHMLILASLLESWWRRLATRE